MAFVKGQQGAGRGGIRKKPPLVLPPLVVPAGIPIEEFAASVKQASELVGVKFQGLYGQIERGTLSAYIGPGGRKFILLSDLAASEAGQKQADAVATEDHRQNWRAAHISDGACIGGRCTHWSHSTSDVLEPRNVSSKMAAHLARIGPRGLAKATVANAERARLQALDIAEQRTKWAAEQAEGSTS